MKRAVYAFGIILAVAIGACSNAQSSNPLLMEQMFKATPIRNASAASSRFFSCKVDAPNMICKTCGVTQHDKGADGIVTYATHWVHTLKSSEEKASGYTMSSAGELGDEKFESSERSLSVARELFQQAEDWCSTRGKGEYRLLKDEMANVYGAGQ